MISEKDRAAIVDLASRYGVERVLLFGSSADPEKDARDIDLAVEGVPPGEYFSLYGDLILALSRPVDLVDLSFTSKFVDLVRREGVLIYGTAA